VLGGYSHAGMTPGVFFPLAPRVISWGPVRKKANDRAPPSRSHNWGAGQAVREWSARQQWPQLSPRCEHPNWPLTLGDRPDGLVHRQLWRGVKSSVSRTLATTEMDLSRPRAIVMLRGNDHLFEPGPHVGSQDHVRPPHSKGCSNVVAAS
jgi:hypothetical protein